MVIVSSTCINRIDYDKATKTLYIEFQKGNRYQYTDVPHREYETFMGAESLGSYFNRFIKHRYPYKRIN
jgi:hypothetical protein